jgi:methyl-accepting chemotaxis protein/methyl-accepting chemotaxis protein-1 (serine sensor receptor)
MGFAVVADEVRNLAQRSAQAARDTASLIEESITKSSAGSRKLDQVAQSIHQITASTTQVKTLMDEIAAGTQEQSRGIEQIAEAVLQMEKATQQGSARAEECASVGEGLSDKTKSLRSAVDRIQQLTGSSSESPVEYLMAPKEPSPGPKLLSPAFQKRRIDRSSFPLEQDGEEC